MIKSSMINIKIILIKKIKNKAKSKLLAYPTMSAMRRDPEWNNRHEKTFWMTKKFIMNNKKNTDKLSEKYECITLEVTKNALVPIGW